MIRRWLIPFGISAICWSCATETLSELPLTKEKESYRLRIHIDSSPYTRAAEGSTKEIDENRIQNIAIAFYHFQNGTSILDKTFRGIPEPLSPGDFTIEYHGNPENFPHLAVAVANGPEEFDTYLDPLTALRKNAVNANNLLFASSRYFDFNRNDTYGTKLTSENFTEGQPVDIFLERIAAKVSLQLSEGFYATPLTLKSNGEEIPLHLTITGWGAKGIDTCTYLMKHIGSGNTISGAGYAEMERELTSYDGEWRWNRDATENDYPTLHWAHSPSWENNEFDNEENGPVSFLRYSEALLQLTSGDYQGDAAYVNESTRRGEITDIPGAIPSIAIAGCYETDTGKGMTFYREGTECIGTEDYYRRMWIMQSALFRRDDNGITEIGLSEFLTLTEETRGEGKYSESVTLKLKSDADLILTGINPEHFCDKTGNPISGTEGRENVDAALLEQCGYREKYSEGRCFFILPIRHLRPGDNATGCYGIVRNHHYSVTLNAITSPGRGVADAESFLRERGDRDDIPDYTIEIKLNVTERNDTGIQDAPLSPA